MTNLICPIVNGECDDPGCDKGDNCVLRDDTKLATWATFNKDNKAIVQRIRPDLIKAERTELQYNLQKARALATELRFVLEEIDGDEGFDNDSNRDGNNGDAEDHAISAGLIESWLDDMDPHTVGQGSVKLTIEEFTK